MLKIIHIAPQNKAHWFNLALSQEQFATTALRNEKKTPADIKRAVNDLIQALNIFKNLAIPDLTSKLNLPTRAEKHVKYCEQTLELGKKQRARAEENERKLIEKRERVRQIQMEEELKKAKEEEEKQIENNIKQLEEERKAKEMLAKAEEVARSLQDAYIHSRETKEKRRRKSEKSSFIQDDEDENTNADL